MKLLRVCSRTFGPPCGTYGCGPLIERNVPCFFIDDEPLVLPRKRADYTSIGLNLRRMSTTNAEAEPSSHSDGFPKTRMYFCDGSYFSVKLYTKYAH